MPRKKKSYTAEFKLLLVEHAEEHGNRPTARLFSVPENNIRKWRLDKHKLQTQPSWQSKTIKGCHHPRMEEELVKWIKDMYRDGRGELVTMETLCSRALQWAEKAGETFKASPCWAKAFVRRHNVMKERIVDEGGGDGESGLVEETLSGGGKEEKGGKESGSDGYVRMDVTEEKIISNRSSDAVTQQENVGQKRSEGAAVNKEQKETAVCASSAEESCKRIPISCRNTTVDCCSDPKETVCTADDLIACNSALNPGKPEGTKEISGVSLDVFEISDRHSDLDKWSMPWRSKNGWLSKATLFKLCIVEFAEIVGIYPAGRWFGVPDEWVKSLMQEKTSLQALSNDRKYSCRKDNCLYPELDDALVRWIFEQYLETKGDFVAPKMIRSRARQWAQEAGIPGETFSPSDSWVDNFLYRYRDFELPVKPNKPRLGRSVSPTVEDKKVICLLTSESEASEVDERTPSPCEFIERAVLEGINSSGVRLQRPTERVQDEFPHCSQDHTNAKMKHDDIERNYLNQQAERELHPKTSPDNQAPHRDPKIGRTVLRRKRLIKKLKPADKLKIVAYAEEHGNRKAGRRFATPESNVRLWRQGKMKLQSRPRDKKNKRGEMCHYPEMEEELVRWVLQQYVQNCGRKVSQKMIRDRAQQLMEKAGNKKHWNFKDYGGWIVRFLKRYEAFDLPIEPSCLGTN